MRVARCQRCTHKGFASGKEWKRRMSKAVIRPPSFRRSARPGEALLSNRLLALATLLRRSANVVYRRELSLTEVEWRILAMVGDHGPLTLSALVDIVGLDKGQLSRNVTALVKRRLLTRAPAPHEGREVHIAFTPTGKATFDRQMILALERNRELVAGLDRGELASLQSALDRLLANAKIMLAQGKHS
jgi:DNA-binding MarR family transcriptional regulator